MKSSIVLVISLIFLYIIYRDLSQKKNNPGLQFLIAVMTGILWIMQLLNLKDSILIERNVEITLEKSHFAYQNVGFTSGSLPKIIGNFYIFNCKDNIVVQKSTPIPKSEKKIAFYIFECDI